jgi:branched-chain amino acid transport system permease protein
MAAVAWQSLLSGLAQGLLYALLASGFALIFGVGRTFNLAHGELVILGGYVAYWLQQWVGLDPLLSIPVALLLGGLAGVLLQRAAAMVREPFELNALVLTFGTALVLQSLMQNLWTANYRLVVPYFSGSVELVGARLSLAQLAGAATGLVGWGALTWMLTRTTFGRGLRAASQDRNGASLVGISPEHMEVWAFALGAAAAAAAGPLFSLMHLLSPSAGLNITVIALTISVLGGVGRMGAVLAAALFIGVVEALTVGVVGTPWRGIVLFGLLLVLLRLRAPALPGGVEP